jgi:hypothetical protein
LALKLAFRGPFSDISLRGSFDCKTDEAAVATVSIEEVYLPWSPACIEYFERYALGRYDAPSYLWFLLPIEKSSLDYARGAFVIGHAGCDGIEICFRVGQLGVWAYYPSEERWELKADTLDEFERGWLDRSITV